MIWIIADSHYGHANIIRYCNRPFTSVEEMDSEIMRRWNSVVAPGDLVYHLGDFALGRAENLREIPRKLKGTIVLIMGNHDHKSVGFWAKLGIVAYKRPIIVDNMIFSHQPVIDPELPNVHGHTHNNNTNISGIHVCVSVEQINYTPITIERVKELINIKSEAKHGDI